MNTSLDLTQPKLTPLCAAFVEAMNRHNVDAFVACFSPQALVEDEEATHSGQAQIRAWIENAFTKYRPVLEVTEVKSYGMETTITGPVSGTFDGSPIVLRYRLTFQDGKIATLKCDA